MKLRVVCWFVLVAASIGLAPAQNSSSATPTRDPLLNATKPLTPKSAMPTQSKSSGGVSNVSKNGSTNAELSRLERQNIKAGDPKKVTTGASKSTSVKTSANVSANSGSGINFQYQKPVGGMKASTPGANAKSSATPRVKKN
jgi:hypothetical protein